MADRKGNPRRSDNGINIYINDEERSQLDGICEYLGISRSQFVRIVTDYVFERTVLGNYQVDAEEIANKHGVGYGVVEDIFGQCI